MELAPNWQNQAYYFPTIGSTNQEARLRLQIRPREMLLTTDKQTAGRGRLARTWEAPFGTGLLSSLTLPLEPLPLEQAYLYTASLGLAVQEAVWQLTQTRLDLKWPNDLLREGRKCGGILAELEANWLILGFGLNISLTETDLLQAGLSDKATNIVPDDIEREQLLARILEIFSTYRERLQIEPLVIWQMWAANLITLGQHVQVVTVAGQNEFEGQAIKVDQSGRLWVQDMLSQELRAVQAGDVSIRLSNGRYA